MRIQAERLNEASNKKERGINIAMGCGYEALGIFLVKIDCFFDVSRETIDFAATYV